MKYSSIIICLVLCLVSACTSQSTGPAMGDDFDQLKAAKTRVSLGLTYLKNGNYSQAKFNLDKALEFAPRSADVHYALAYYYQSVEETAAAEKSYQKAMDYAPDNADIANSYGAFLCQQGDYPKAKSYFLKAINTSNYSSSAETYENLALCSQNQGYQAEATEFLRSAVNHQPGRAKSLYLLTQSLVAEQKWQEAKEVLKKYEKVSPISPEILLMSSQIEHELGNEMAASSYGDMLLKIYPDSPQSSTYKRRLIMALKGASPVARKSLKAELPTQAVTTADSANDSPAPTITDTLAAPTSPKTNNSEPVEKKQGVSPSAQPADEKTGGTSSPAQFHVVAAGENLYRISLHYNIKMQRLIEWNHLTSDTDIYPGKKLWLVAPESADRKE